MEPYLEDYVSQVADSYSVLGRALQQLRQTEAAEAAIYAGMEIEETYLGANHPHTIDSHILLGFFYREEGQLERAIRIWRDTHNRQEEHLGPHHMNITFTATLLAESLALENPLEAEAFLDLNFAIERMDGPGNIQIDLWEAYQYGRVHYVAGNWEQAKTWLERSAVIQQSMASGSGMSFPIIPVLLGMTNTRLGDFHTAERLLNKAAKKAPYRCTRFFAVIRLGLMQLYHATGRIEMAADQARALLDFGWVPGRTLRYPSLSHWILAKNAALAGDRRTAEKELERMWYAVDQTLPAVGRVRAEVYGNAAEVWMLLGRDDQAAQALETASSYLKNDPFRTGCDVRRFQEIAHSLAGVH